MKTITQIKDECREIVSRAEFATKGPWKAPERQGESFGDTLIMLDDTYEGWKDDVDLVARSRTFAPQAAKAFLAFIAIFEEHEDYASLQNS